jgi:hypothetical protein
VLIAAGRRIVEGIASKSPPNPPNPAGIKQLEYTLAAVWLLLTHDANRRYLERASIYTPPTKGFTRPETRGARLTIHSNPNSPRSRTHSSAHTHLMSRGSFGLTDLSQVLEVTPRAESGGAGGLGGEGEVLREGQKGSEAGTSEVKSRAGEYGGSFSNVKAEVESVKTDVAAGGASSPNRSGQVHAGRDAFGPSLSLESARNAREQEELSRNRLEPQKPLGRRARPSTASDAQPSGSSGQSTSLSSGLFGSRAPKATDKSFARQRTLQPSNPGVFTQLLDSPQKKAARKLPGDPLTSGLNAEVKGLEFLVGIIASRGSLKGAAWDACKHLAVNAVLVATQSLVEYEKKVIDLGIGPALAAVAKDPDASEGLRKASAKFCQVSGTAMGEKDLSPTCRSYWMKTRGSGKVLVPSWSSRIRS